MMRHSRILAFKRSTAILGKWLILLCGLLGALAAPLRAQAPLQKFNYQQNIGPWRFELELFAQSPELAKTSSDELFASLQKHYRQLQQAQALLEAARKSTVPVPAEVYKLFEKLLKVCELSDGAFDPSDQPLRQLWGFSPDALSYHVPTAAELASARQLVNCKQLELKSVPPTLYLANPRIQISWNQFASGWLMDQALQSLEKFPAARLSTQGVTYYHGSPLDAPAWKVPVPNPRHPEETMTYLYLKNQALSVLGDYQDYFLHNGVRYSSLLDPRTGLPNSESIAVHVVSATAMDAELIARAVAILDDEGSKQLLKALQRSSVYKIVDRNGLLVPLSY